MEKFFVVEVSMADRGGSTYYYTQRGLVYNLEKADRIAMRADAEAIAKQFYELFPDSEPKQFRVEEVETFMTIRRVKDRSDD